MREGLYQLHQAQVVQPNTASERFLISAGAFSDSTKTLNEVRFKE